MGNEDLALLAARFGAALRGAGVPADPARCERFAAAVTVARLATLYELYLCALATLVTAEAQVGPLRRVFEAFFGPVGEEPPPGRADLPGPPATPDDLLAAAARAAQQHGQPGDGEASAEGPSAGGQLRIERVPVGDGEPSDGADEDGPGIPALASRAERLAGPTSPSSPRTSWLRWPG